MCYVCLDRWLTRGLSSIGHEAGQTVPHTHFHIIPRGGEGQREATDTLNGKTRGYVSIRNFGLKIEETDVNRFEVAMGMEKKLYPKEAKALMKSIKDGVRQEVDELRSSGVITDGRFLWEYWGSVEGRRGLKL